MKSGLLFSSLRNSLCRSFFTLLLSALGIFGLPTQTSAAVILQYHHVSSDTPPSTSIDPDLFEEHLEYLAENDFDIWPLPKLIEHLKNKQALPDKVVAITFDDAYRSVYTEAFPLLKERNWPFTIFVSKDQVFDNSKDFLSWGELNKMAAQGATIANHTGSHVHMVRRQGGENKQQWLSRITEEVRATEQIIQQKTGQNHRLLAYPFGEYTHEVQELIAELGFIGLGQQSGAVGLSSDLLALPRFPMTNVYGAMSQFPDKVRSLPLDVKDVLPGQHLLTDDNLLESGLKLIIDGKYSNLSQLSCFLSPYGKMPIKVSENSNHDKEPKQQVVLIKGPIKLKAGRSRINCTLPASDPEFRGRFHWYSHPWIRKPDNGAWYSE
jgi:biofilm PGA synthesis lipoprotein PgaB